MSQLTLEDALAIGDEWHRGPGTELHQLARSGTIGCRRRLITEIARAHSECVATAHDYGPGMIDTPEEQDEMIRDTCTAEAARLTALTDWLNQQNSGCTRQTGCPGLVR